MKLVNYIKTDNIEIIRNFTELCKKQNMEIDVDYENDLDDDDICGVGIFLDTIRGSIKIVNGELLPFKPKVCVIHDDVSGGNLISLENYESFILNFNVDEYFDFLKSKFDETKQKFPEFKIGVAMISDIDIEYEFFKSKDWSPYILIGYTYSEISNQWSPRTDKGFGDFERFKLWDTKFLSMSKKELKKYI
jgi:hypothetical protein